MSSTLAQLCLHVVCDFNSGGGQPHFVPSPGLNGDGMCGKVRKQQPS